MAMVFTTAEYEAKKIEFLHKHINWEVDTSPMNQYGEYHKNYICEDGAVWTELVRPVDSEAIVDVEICKCKFKTKISVKMLEVEGWSTDDSRSIYCYEKF